VVKVLPPELGSYFNRMGSDVHLGLSVDVAEEVTKESRVGYGYIWVIISSKSNVFKIKNKKCTLSTHSYI